MGLESGYTLDVAKVNEKKVREKLEALNVLAGDKIVAVNQKDVNGYGEYREAMDKKNFNNNSKP